MILMAHSQLQPSMEHKDNQQPSCITIPILLVIQHAYQLPIPMFGIIPSHVINPSSLFESPSINFSLSVYSWIWVLRLSHSPIILMSSLKLLHRSHRYSPISHLQTRWMRWNPQRKPTPCPTSLERYTIYGGIQDWTSTISQSAPPTTWSQPIPPSSSSSTTLSIVNYTRSNLPDPTIRWESVTCKPEQTTISILPALTENTIMIILQEVELYNSAPVRRQGHTSKLQMSSL